MIPAHLNAARRAVAALFVVLGLLTGGWAPHIPLVKEALGVGPGLLGWLLLSAAAGGVAAMPIAGGLINRLGSATLCRVAGVAMALSFPLPVLATTPLGLAAGLALFGAAMGMLDVAMNAHGIAVERRLERPVLSALHGWFSVGAALGAGAGGAMIASVGPGYHVALSVLVSLAAMGWASTALLPSSEDKGLSDTHFGWPTRATLGLGCLAFLALFAEGAMLDWLALHLRQNTGAGIGLAGLAFAAFSAGMAVARFSGDWLRERLGSVRLVQISAAAMAIGLAVALALPWPVLAALAFVVAGLGLGNVAPVLFAGGGRAEPDAPGRGIAAVTTMGYSGFLIGPPGIGMLAEGIGLRAALGLTVVAALVIALFARAAGAADH